MRLEPRPVQTPYPRITVGGGLSTVSCDLAADLALPFCLPSLFCSPEDYLPIVERYRARMTERGMVDKISVGYPSYVHVAGTSQQARARFRPYLENYARFALEHRGCRGRQLETDAIMNDAAICGSPAEVVDRIGFVNEKLGLNLHYLMPDLGGLPPGPLEEVMDLLATEVLPHLR